MRCLSLILIVAGLLQTLPVVTFAQQAKPAPAIYEPADVQTKASRVYVFVDKTGLGHQHGVEAMLGDSTLRLGATNNAGQLVFDMASFRADTAAARKYVGLSGTTDESTRAAVDENMKGSAVLDVSRYPTATFDVTSAEPIGQTSKKGMPLYQLVGQFTLHGVKRPLNVAVEVEQTQGWLHLRGNFAIKQTDFGITPFSKAFGAIGVADELKIYGDLYVAPTEHVSMSEIPARK
ncbi:MAG: YceI family protein [Pirellulaceae bacterium]